MALIDVKVPDIGDFKDVAVIEVLVKPGDAVKAEQSLITVESDKASMEIPSSHAGVVKELKVKLGDTVNEGAVILSLEAEGAAAAAPAPQRRPQPQRPRQHPHRRSAAPQAARFAGSGGPRMRHARAGRRARRLLGCVSLGRPRHEDRARRALPDARRRVPERRLHSVEGAAARRRGDGRSEALRRPRRLVRRRRKSTCRSCSRTRTRWWASSPAASRRWRRCARSRSCRAAASSPTRTT